MVLVRGGVSVRLSKATRFGIQTWEMNQDTRRGGDVMGDVESEPRQGANEPSGGAIGGQRSTALVETDLDGR